MTPKIQIWTRLHESIYRSLGGGEARVVAEWRYGPRNLVTAWRELDRVRRANVRNYGNIGCGKSWLETTDGRQLCSMLQPCGDEPHAELVKDLEQALLTPAQWDEMNKAWDATYDDEDAAA